MLNTKLIGSCTYQETAEAASTGKKYIQNSFGLLRYKKVDDPRKIPNRTATHIFGFQLSLKITPGLKAKQGNEPHILKYASAPL